MQEPHQFEETRAECLDLFAVSAPPFICVGPARIPGHSWLSQIWNTRTGVVLGTYVINGQSWHALLTIK
jgi:hypothetical protein